MRDYIALTKPRITWLILMTTGVGYYFGVSAGTGWNHYFDAMHVWRLLHTLIGTALIASGTAALNQWYERDADARMKRTRARPIPAGRLTSGRALFFGCALSLAGFLELLIKVNPLSGVLGAFTLLSYLFLYTPLKQRTWLCTSIGAVPGAMPPMIGFAAAHGSLNAVSFVLFAILFFWQFPHFYAIAWMYRDDYARAGIRMLPVVEPDCRSTARQMTAFGAILILASVVPVSIGMSGDVYLAGAVILGLWFLYFSLRATRDRTRTRARGVLLASVVYLPLLLGLMVLDRL